MHSVGHFRRGDSIPLLFRFASFFPIIDNRKKLAHRWPWVQPLEANTVVLEEWTWVDEAWTTAPMVWMAVPGPGDLFGAQLDCFGKELRSQLTVFDRARR
jgi:hypothetical protein